MNIRKLNWFEKGCCYFILGMFRIIAWKYFGPILANLTILFLVFTYIVSDLGWKMVWGFYVFSFGAMVLCHIQLTKELIKNGKFNN